ncbi:hypothetical protein [Candidatus Neptunichlamydia sp. REUL1]|uniref:hypothetical protein n=1 Tax=Candidatus Neptunichlamydia sp. REUL1 TaxID=3064277 RepID=UPI00292FEAE4|nr:hypothetical protein [Candidatus Neptunochlamydia sp. REUL1]
MKEQPKASSPPVYFVLFIDNFAFAVIFAIFGPLFIDPPYGYGNSSNEQRIKKLNA